MTAVFTGLGAGLAKSSASALGSAGTLGGAATGRAGEGISVNAATGNLLISRRDEFLTGRSLDVGISRTYNSLAEVHDGDNGDKWQMSTARRVYGQSGTLNAAGSTIKRVSGDGSVVTYKYETRGGEAGYWSTDGSGTHDKMWLSGGDWYWRDGSSRITERYDADPHNAGEFRIIRQTDKDGQSLVFEWGADNKLDYVKTNNNEYIRYTWSGNKLTGIKSEFVDPRLGTTVTETGTYYAYDGNGRLATVTIDLSPDKAGTSDGDKFTISYLYDSAGRVTRVTQSDGSRTDIAYTSGKVTKLTEHVGDGTTRITQLAYGTNYTNVTAPNGQVTRLDFNSATKLLTKITAPPAYTGAAAQVQTFAYNSANDLISSTDPQGRVTNYTYDARGNVTKVDRPIGTDVTRYYDANDNLVKELSYSSNEASSNTNNYTRYAYDVENHLRYKVTAEGHVTEYRYDSYGRLAWEGTYTKDAVSRSSANLTEADMNAWRDGLADKTNVDWQRYVYDARGNLSYSMNYGSATSTGGASTSGEAYSRTFYVYDQEGRLLTRYGQSETGKEQFVYDGMGRLVSSSTASGETTSIYFDDANTSTVMRLASGLTRTMVYNKAGDLISSTESSVGPTSANLAPALTSWSNYNNTRTAAGTINGGAAYTYNNGTNAFSYVARSTSVAAGETVRVRMTIKGDGVATQHRLGIYSGIDQWGTNTGAQSEAIIIDGPGKLSRVVGGLWLLEGVSASTTTTIEVVRTFDAATSAGAYFYPGAGNAPANSNVTLVNPLLVKSTADASLDFTATTNNKYDKLGRLRVTQDAFDGRGANYVIYDKAGRKVGVVDPSRRLTEYFYDPANRLIGTTTYANAITTTRYTQLANPDNTLEMSAIRPTLDDTYDVRELTTYDANGRVAQTINGEGEIVSYKYDNSGRLIETRNHFNKVSIASAWRTAPPASPVTIANHGYDAVTRTFYDRDGNVRGVLDGEKFLTEFTYDQSGQKTVETRYALASTRTDWATASFNTLRSAIGLTNVNNRHVRSVYNGRGELRFQIDSANYVTQFNYNYAGKLTKTTQHQTALAGGHSDWTIAGVKAGLASNTNDRSVTNYYDANGRLWRTVEAGGLDTRMYFDYAGNVIKTTAGNRTVRAWHDARGNVRFSMDAEGYLTSYLYNEGGQVTHERRYDARKSASDTTTIQQIAAQATGGYSETSNTYDSQGRVIYSYDAVGNRTRYVYRTNGQLAYVNTGDNNSNHRAQTYYYYDNAGRLTRQDNANGQTEESITYFTYDGLGNQTQVKDGNGKIAYFTYDKRGQVLTEKNGAGNLVRYEYNAFGQVTKAWDARGTLASEHVYDKRGLVTRSYDALRKYTDYTYTQFGEVKTVKDPLGAVTTFTYDKLGRVVSTKDSLNKTESYGYDAYGNRTSVTNKLGGSITYAYDKLGRMTSMNDANGIVTAYTYDARGNRLTVTEASGRSEARKTTYTYDKSNRMLSSSVEGHSGSYTTQYAYDSRGNVVRQIAPDGGKTVYFYDDLGRVTTEINALGTYTAYTYDDNGNVKTIKVYATAAAVPSTGGAEEQQPAPPSGSYRETRFDYDGANRMTKSHVIGVTSRYYTGSSLATYSGTTLTTQYVYDANGNVVQTIDPNGNTTWAFYDAMGRKQHQVDAQNYRTTWVYDAGGNVTREVAYANATATPTSTTSVPGVSTNTALDRRTDYTYDKMGNRLSEQRFYVKYHNGSGAHTTGHPKITYTYNALGQVTKKTEAITSNVTDYTYDVGGRLTKEQRASFTDYNGNTVRPTVDYYYDGLGNLTRTRQAGATGAAERNTYYYYKKGMLDRMTDAGGLTRYYRYDNAGRETEVYYTRNNYYGTARTEGVKRTYDKLGRVVSEFQGTKSGSTWTAVSPTIATTYNAYGEVATIKAGTGAVQTNVYDKAGRLEQTNSGDGVWKMFAYDRNGNQTAAITSAGYNLGNRSFASALGYIGRADVNITYTTYDKRGSALKVYETDRDISTTAADQTLVTQRSYNAFGEVAYEIDAANARIDYTYNTMGKVIEVKNPTVAIQNENGSIANVRPTEHYYYDLGGRLVGQRDANGNLTRMAYLNGTGFAGSEGLVTSQTFADGGVKTYKYDVHGDQRKIIEVADGRSAAYRTIDQTFDKMGRVTQTWNRGSNLQDNYTYDLAGQQLSHWNNVYGSGNREIMDYDAMGRVTSSRAFGGDTTTTTYTWEVSSNTNAVGNYGGWKEETKTLANNRTSTVWTDLFDRTVRKNDFGSNNYTYGYDAAGRLASLTGSGANQQYAYYNSGKLKSIASVTGVVNSENFQELKTTYGYDKVGNLTSQKTTDRGSTFYQFYWNQYEPDYYSYSWNRTTQNMTATYDALGRMKSWSEVGGGDLPAASMTWTYDANGNIRRSRATYRAIYSDQSIATNNSTQDNWYRFDNMNRVVTSRGVLSNGQIVRGTAGIDVAYNKAGQRTSVTTTQRESHRWYYDPNGGEDLWQEPGFNDGPGSGSSGYWRTAYYNADVREDYLYDAGGRLRQVNVAKSSFDSYSYEQAVTWGYGSQNPNDYVGSVPANGAKKADYTYDALGRVTLQRDYSGSTVVHSTNTYYDAQGLVSRTDSTTKRGSDSYRANQYNTYNQDNTLNNSLTYNYKNGSTSGVSHTRTTNTYRWYDGAVQSRVDFDSNTGSTSDRIYNSTYSYDALGVLQSAQINDGRSRSVSFINSAEGQVISRKERDNKSGGDPTQIYYRFGGKEIGRVGNDGTANVTYEKSIAERTKAPVSDPGAFRGGASYGVGHADFGGDYDAINSFQQGAGGGTYTVRGGESLQAIAMQLWGDGALWYKLAEANGLSGREPLIEGRSLVIPSGIQRVHHNSSTMKPYDPAEAIGDTSPTTPDQPKKKSKKCGVFGQIILAVVSIAVTAVLTPVIGPVGAAAVGNIASQAVGVATGIQERFSFKSLAMATLSAGVTQGVGDVLGQGAMFGSQIAGDAIRGALGSALTQGIGVATGLQDKFSWAGVAAAGVGAGVASALGGDLDNLRKNNSISNHLNHLGVNTAASIAGAATRSAIEGSSFGRNLVNAIPGVAAQAISNALLYGISIPKPEEQMNDSPSTNVGNTAGRDAERIIVSAQSTGPTPVATDPGSTGSQGPAQEVQSADQADPQNTITVTGTRQAREPYPVSDLRSVQAVNAFLIARYGETPGDDVDLERARHVVTVIFGDRRRVDNDSAQWELATSWLDDLDAGNAISQQNQDDFVNRARADGYLIVIEGGEYQKVGLEYDRMRTQRAENGERYYVPDEQFFYVTSDLRVTYSELRLVSNANRTQTYSPDKPIPADMLFGIHTHQDESSAGHNPNPGPLDATYPYANPGTIMYGISSKNAWGIIRLQDGTIDAYTVSGRWDRYTLPGSRRTITFRESTWETEVSSNRGAHCPSLTEAQKRQYGCN